MMWYIRFLWECNNNNNINNILFSLFIDRYNLPSDVRLAMYEEAEKWVRALGRRKFMGGSAPNLADLVSEWLYSKP